MCCRFLEYFWFLAGQEIFCFNGTHIFLTVFTNSIVGPYLNLNECISVLLLYSGKINFNIIISCRYKPFVYHFIVFITTNKCTNKYHNYIYHKGHCVYSTLLHVSTFFHVIVREFRINTLLSYICSSN